MLLNLLLVGVYGPLLTQKKSSLLTNIYFFLLNYVFNRGNDLKNMCCRQVAIAKMVQFLGARRASLRDAVWNRNIEISQ